MFSCQFAAKSRFYSITGLALLLASAVFSQPAATGAGTGVFIKGTKISMVPPEAFVPAGNFAGFQQEASGASIMVVSIPAPYETIAASMNSQGFASQGIVVDNTEKLQISGLPGILMSGSQKAHGLIYIRYSLIFGNEKESIIINGACPDKSAGVPAKIKASILTTVYHPDVVIDPVAEADFELDTKPSQLRFAGNVANSLIFTMDGNLPPEVADKTMLVAAKSFSELAVSQQKEFATRRLQGLPMTIEKVISTDSVMTDSLAGYEILAEGTSRETGIREFVLLHILYGESYYYLMVGTTEKETILPRLKTVIRSFRRKKP